jgi:hypothetical protein
MINLHAENEALLTDIMISLPCRTIRSSKSFKPDRQSRVRHFITFKPITVSRHVMKCMHSKGSIIKGTWENWFCQNNSFFFNSLRGGGGVQLGPLGTAATDWPIVPAPGDDDDGEFGGMKIGR